MRNKQEGLAIEKKSIKSSVLRMGRPDHVAKVGEVEAGVRG